MRKATLYLLLVCSLGLMARAHAETAYFLVGLRHIYRLDAYPDPNGQDRQAIEQDYLDAIERAQQQFDADMTSIKAEEAEDSGNVHAIDRDAVQQNLEQDIEGAAEIRDENLSQLYRSCDEVREGHPEFQVDQDGPYAVMSADFEETGEVSEAAFISEDGDRQDACPDDLAWNEVYSFATFMTKKREAHRRWLTTGKPLFRTVRIGGSFVTFVTPVRFFVILDRKAWVNGRPPNLTSANRFDLAQAKEQQTVAGLRVILNYKRKTTRANTTLNRTAMLSNGDSRYSNPPAKGQAGTGESTSKSRHHLF